MSRSEIDNRTIRNKTVMIRLKPKDSKAYYSRGCSYQSISEYDLAIEDYSRAIELNRRFSRAYRSRGSAYLLKYSEDDPIKGDDLALKDYSKCIKYNPLWRKGYEGRAYIYYRRGEYKKARKDCKRALLLSLLFTSDEKLVNRLGMMLGDIYFNLGLYDKARKAFYAAFKFDNQLGDEISPYLNKIDE